jgi:hypothetical protein
VRIAGCGASSAAAMATIHFSLADSGIRRDHCC